MPLPEYADDLAPEGAGDTLPGVAAPWASANVEP